MPKGSRDDYAAPSPEVSINSVSASGPYITWNVCLAIIRIKGSSIMQDEGSYDARACIIVCCRFTTCSTVERYVVLDQSNKRVEHHTLSDGELRSSSFVHSKAVYVLYVQC